MGPVVPSQICQVLRRIYRGCRYAAVGTHTHTGVTCTLAPLYISPLRPCYGKFTGCDGKCMEFPWDINRKKKNFNMTSNHVTLSYMLTGTGGGLMFTGCFSNCYTGVRGILPACNFIQMYGNTVTRLLYCGSCLPFTRSAMRTLCTGYIWQIIREYNTLAGKCTCTRIAHV